MKLWNYLFKPSTAKSRDPQVRGAVESEPGHVGHDVYVFWPDNEIQSFSVGASVLNPKLLDRAQSMLSVLASVGSVTRASVATGRVQTLTQLSSATGATSVRGVQISSEGSGNLVVVFMLAGCVDAGQAKIALRRGLDEHKVSAKGIEAVLGRFPDMPAMAIVAFGPKTDPEIDEAFGLAIYLGAAARTENLGAAAKTETGSSAMPPKSPVPRGFRIDRMTLEALALLNQRSAFILTGVAKGSRSEAEAWDRWLESYRLPSFQDGLPLLHEAGQEHIVSVELMVATALWGECPNMPIRFVGTFGSTSAYAIPWDADPVPDIRDYQRPAAEEGSRLASIEGQVKRLGK